MMRKGFLLGGCLVLAVVWLGPRLMSADFGFVGHMTVHVTLVAVAAPLLAVGLGGSRFDPTPALPFLFGAITASALEFAIVWTWHAPALHVAARGSSAILAVEQLSFLAAGLLVWLAAFGRGRGPAAAVWAPGVLALFLTSMHMTLLGALLALSPRPLYGHAHRAGWLGLTPLEDQQLGGVVMLLVGGASYLIGGLVLIARLLRQPGAGVAPTRRQER